MRIFSIALLLSFGSMSFAQRDATVPDPDPELERKTFVVPDGFEVNLFASDPLLAKPIQINFSADGRLWVASSEVYPQIQPGQQANDRIVILEDSNRDGRADKTTVFADGLLIPTGVAPGDGGAYVANSTDLVHFSDPDPVTGKARKKQIVLSGFGTEDTHHILHTLRWGPDGSLYMNQSIYIHSHIETPHGVRRLNAGGVWRFRPRTLELDVFARGFVNSWGTAFNRWGQSFATDGAYFDGINILMPGAYYVTAQGANRFLPGLNPGSPKHCGLAVISGRHFPPEFDGMLVTNDFRGHRVCRFSLSDDGAGYVSREGQELIRSTHPAFRPIDVTMGPDGALYVADWYNPIIQHGEVDFRDPRRDKTHGRIWRITAKNRPLVPVPKLTNASVEELLEHLKAPEDWTRQQAKLVMREMGAAKVIPALEKWVATNLSSGPAHLHAKLEALWTCQCVVHVNEPLLRELMTCSEASVRAAACRVAGDWAGQIPQAQRLLAICVRDENPRVRLEAVRALAKIPSLASAEEAVSVLQYPVDRWIDYALWLTLRELKAHWLEAVVAGQFAKMDNPKVMTALLRSAESDQLLAPLRKLLANQTIASADKVELALLLASFGTPNDLQSLLATVPDYGDKDQIRLLQAIETTTRAKKLGRLKQGTVLSNIIRSTQGEARQIACSIAGLWNDSQSREILKAIAQGELDNANLSVRDRQSAFSALAALGSNEENRWLEVQATSDNDPVAQGLAIVTLSSANLDQAGSRLAQWLIATPASQVAPEILSSFLQRKGAAAALQKHLKNKTLSRETGQILLQVLRSGGTADAGLLAEVMRAASITATRRSITGPELERFLTAVRTQGDPKRGEDVYRRSELQCLKCHAIAGAGGQVGPDMTSIGASAQVDYLLESLLLPNAKIKEGYHSLVLATEEGKSITGIKVSEDDRQMLIRDAENREFPVLKAEIVSQRNGPSLMPEGLVDPLSDQDLLDLVRFLSELGKGEYLAKPGSVVRQWEVLQATREVYEDLGRKGFNAIPTDTRLKWLPLYSRTSGEIPLQELPRFRVNADSSFQAAIRFRVNVTQSGPVKLRVNDAKGISLWLDGIPTELKPETVIVLEKGVRQFTLGLEPDRLSTGPTVEVLEIENSPARFTLQIIR